MPTRILLADDHALFREGLKALLVPKEFEVVAEAGSGHDAIRLARQHLPDVAMIDISMPGLNGVDTGARDSPRLAPQQGDRAHHAQGSRLPGGSSQSGGARLHPQESRRRGAARGASRGGARRAFPEPRALARGRGIVPRCRVAGREPLSPRERQVLQLIAEGMTTKEIAATLFISFKTAESHRQRIMGKLDIHETASLVRYAIRSGLTQP